MGFHHLIARLGKVARMPFAIHPHMLRHACGFKLANEGHDTRALQHYLGHRNIQHTVRYTELRPEVSGGNRDFRHPNSSIVRAGSSKPTSVGMRCVKRRELAKVGCKRTNKV